MFISSAFAQDAAQTMSTSQSAFAQLAPLLLIMVVFYFLLIRPQQKRMRDHQAMIGALRRGDRVVTSGGIVGVVSRIENDEQIMVEIAPDVQVKMVRSTISQVLTKSDSPVKEIATPSAANDGASAAKAAKKKR
jgi:preprotein translocase subunit YajC